MARGKAGFKVRMMTVAKKGVCIKWAKDRTRCLHRSPVRGVRKQAKPYRIVIVSGKCSSLNTSGVKKVETVGARAKQNLKQVANPSAAAKKNANKQGNFASVTAARNWVKKSKAFRGMLK